MVFDEGRSRAVLSNAGPGERVLARVSVGLPSEQLRNIVPWEPVLGISVDLQGGRQLRTLGRYCGGVLACVVLVVSGSSRAVAGPAPRQPTLSSVSGLQCPSRVLCVSIGVGGLVTSHSPRRGIDGWTAETVDGGRMLKLLTCVSVHWCLSVDQQDRVLTSTNPARGAASWRLAPGGRAGHFDNVAALSRPTRRVCVGLAGHYVISSTIA
jgi:hypothetical protein